MHGDTPITSLNNQSKGQKQQTIPVAALADGAQLFVRGMRLWKKACAQCTCIFAATHQEFSLVINSVTARDAIQDELIVVATLRLIADNRYEQASGQLRNLVKGPLNSSIIRVCADIAVSFKKKQLSFCQGPYMALTNS